MTTNLTTNAAALVARASEADFAAWRASFDRVAPDVTAFDAILERLNTMLTTWPGWSRDQLTGIRAATLIAVGDDDYVRVDHAVEIAGIIANARVAVLPGTTHLGIVRRDAWYEPMMTALQQAEI